MKSSVQSTQPAAPVAGHPETPVSVPASKSNDVLLTIKVVLIAATFFAALWAIDRLVNP